MKDSDTIKAEFDMQRTGYGKIYSGVFISGAAAVELYYQPRPR
jgi:hypothetical protein